MIKEQPQTNSDKPVPGKFSPGRKGAPCSTIRQHNKSSKAEQLSQEARVEYQQLTSSGPSLRLLPFFGLLYHRTQALFLAAPSAAIQQRGLLHPDRSSDLIGRAATPPARTLMEAAGTGRDGLKEGGPKGYLIKIRWLACAFPKSSSPIPYLFSKEGVSVFIPAVAPHPAEELRS